ncbi:uncharacterized protein B0H64DRAFT_414567 [Chaetomium fimeti]|uniref:Uncharacterized protein n=1 Tax=Chaetomium fimeti TaxID=1854472 RepID=A0AAE0HQY1_9PEZI|nr:hypothetical protein B0H64DRAFT_414567 [Chaetomium fimeti]
MVVAVTANLAPGNLQQRVPCSWRARGASGCGAGELLLCRGAPTARRLGVTWPLCSAQQIHVPSNTGTHSTGTSGFRSGGTGGLRCWASCAALGASWPQLRAALSGESARCQAQQWSRGPNVSRRQLKDSLLFGLTGMG